MSLATSLMMRASSRSYVLTGMDSDYNSVVSTMSSLIKYVTVTEHTLRFKVDLLQGGSQSSVNITMRGSCIDGHGRGYQGCGGGASEQGRGSGASGNYGSTTTTGNTMATIVLVTTTATIAATEPMATRCFQLFGKVGHTFDKCWERFNTDFHERSFGAATSLYGVNTTW